MDNYYPFYIPGVGTPFPEIGEISGSTAGRGFGWGGDYRILFGLMQVFNAVHRSFANSGKNISRNTPYFKDGYIKAICNGGVPTPNDMAELKKLTPEIDLSSYSSRLRMIRGQLAALIGLIKHPKTLPKPIEIMIDVFGFSRGAAEARAFTNKLFDLCSGNELFGVPMQLRFLGLFDTVASVNFTVSAGSDGHHEWAQVEDLKIDRRVKNWRHFVGLLEGRASFPLDSARDGNGYPPNGAEIAYPGVHSDIGGGYAIGEQGRAMYYNDDRWQPNDAFKLSQIPLNDMFIAAKAAMVPWVAFDSEQGLRNSLPEAFGIHPSLRTEMASYFANCGIAPTLPIEEMTRQHQLQYLAWRYQVRDRFENLPGTKRATSNTEWRSGREDLIKGNYTFKRQIMRLEDNSLMKWIMSPETGSAGAAMEALFRSPNAKKILDDAKERSTSVPAVVAHFFDQYVHDSYAGFKPLPGDLTEPQGYFHRRVVFAGEHTILDAKAAPQNPADDGNQSAFG
jgi:hypothetical protein